MKKRAFITVIVTVALLTILPIKAKSVTFQDDFEDGASSLWSNSIGNWKPSGGVYYAQQPSNNPVTYTSLPYLLTDFEVSFDMNNIRDGGIFLRSSFNPLNNHISGVYLVAGGHGGTGTGLYWQVAHDEIPTSLPTHNEVSGLFTPGVSDATIRIVVSGNLYSAYINDSTTPETTYTNNEFSSGMIALFDNGVYDQTERQSFDNVQMSGSLVPLPGGLVLLGSGLLLLGLYNRPPKG